MSIKRSCFFLTVLTSTAFVFAEESELVLPILPQDNIVQQEQTPIEPVQVQQNIPESVSTVEPLEDVTQPENTELPQDNLTNEAISTQQTTTQQTTTQQTTSSPVLPDGISEEEARWANWSDWNKVGTKPQDGQPIKQQSIIAPATAEDALVDQSQNTQTVVPQFNEQLDVTKQTLNVDPEEGNTNKSSLENEGWEKKSDVESTQTLPELVENTNNVSNADVQQSESPVIDSVIDSDVRSLVDSSTTNSNSELNTTGQLVHRSEQIIASFRPEITDTITQLIERIQTVRRQYFDKTLNTEQNSPFEAMMSASAFGCFVSLEHRASGTQFNTIGALCWNYPLCEISLLGLNLNPNVASSQQQFLARYPHGRIVQTSYQTVAQIFPYIGYCQQERAGEFLSVLALSRVSADYKFTPHSQVDIDRLIEAQSETADPVSVESLTPNKGTVPFTVADLVHDSMNNCHGGDMSALLVSLAYYVPREQWTNAWGESWSVLRIVDHELKREVDSSDSDSIDRLYGLTFALRRRLAFDDNQWESLYVIVDDYLHRMKDYALSLQNPDGSWNGAFFTKTGKSRNSDADFAASAHFTRWLTIQFQNKALADEQLTKAIEFLVTELEQRLKDYNPSEMSQKDVRAIAYALQAIAIYEQRWSK